MGGDGGGRVRESREEESESDSDEAVGHVVFVPVIYRRRGGME